MTPDSDFDTQPWRVVRDSKLREWIGDEHAVQFTLMLSESSEFFDDLIDRDKDISNEWIVRMMFILLIDMPANVFFSHYKAHLLPLMAMASNAWLDANDLQDGDEVAKSRAYVLRDLTLEVTLHVISIVRGRDYMRSVSLDVRNFFLHESLAQYKDSIQ
jgi:hypothetical protein